MGKWPRPPAGHQQPYGVPFWLAAAGAAHIIASVMKRIWQLPRPWLAVPLVWLFFFLALNSLVGDSPTMDEQNHLARGLAFLRTGDPRLSLEHPPLVNSLSALPLLTLPGIRLPTDDASWEQPEGWYRFAELLLWEYNHDVTRMVFLARLPVVFLTLGLALVGLCFAQALWGSRGSPGSRGSRGSRGSPGSPAGWLAFFALLFDPNILAHGRYSTTDVGGTAFLLLATFLLWRMWSRPGWSWPRLLAAGLGLGLAFGSKLSTLGFVPIFALLALLPLYGQRWGWRPAGRRLAQYLLAGLLSLGVVWAIFGFQWDVMQFRSPALAGLNSWRGPMPTFWAGIEQIAGLSGGGRGAAFLLGQFSTTGFPAYFPVAFLVKTPLATLLLLPLALLLLLGSRATRARGLFLLIPAGVYFLLSTQSALNIGYRHLLPMLALLYVFMSGLGPLVQQGGNRALRWGVGLFPAGLLLATLAVHPHYLSFFNLPAGGPANGYQILIDSNVDWGQDLLRLQAWMAANEVDEVNLSWFGSADPAYYGLNYRPLPGLPRHFDLWWDVPFNSADPEPGVYAISVSNLWEIPLQEEKYVFPWFRQRSPDDRVGYSILIYRVPGEQD